MSRLYGRLEDVNNISNYLINNYKKLYIPSYKEIEDEELMDAPKKIFTYLSKDTINYINDCDIKVFWDKNAPGTVYSGEGEKENIIFFKTRQMREEYKTDFIYFIGDLLRRKNLDYMQDEHDIMCQYSDLLPLLIEYLFLREEGKEEEFSDRNLSDLRLNAKHYHRTYERRKKYPFLVSEETLLNETLLYLVPLSSLDATYQIIDKIGDNKDELRLFIYKLIENSNHNREEIVSERDINTYGFKRLRKEIDLRK
jgi:hypothetical protein